MNRGFLSLALFLSLMLFPYASEFLGIKGVLAGGPGLPGRRVGGGTR